MSEHAERLPQQNRSRVTAERFIEAAFKLLETQTFAELSVGDLARTAKRSVGAFYQRFGSKEEFLKILLVSFLQSWIGESAAANRQDKTARDVYESHLKNIYNRIMAHRNLWHAALELSASDPNFWVEFGIYRERRLEDLFTTIEKTQKRTLTDEERHRLALAGQIFNSVINNQIINSPGPLTLDDDAFFPTMADIVLKVADLEK